MFESDNVWWTRFCFQTRQGCGNAVRYVESQRRHARVSVESVQVLVVLLIVIIRIKDFMP